MESLQIIINSSIEIVVSLVAAIAARVLIPKVTQYIKDKTESNNVRFAMDELEKTAASVVYEIEQRMVKQYKADGVWDASTQKVCLETAADELMNRLSLKTQEIVKNHGVDIDNLVVSYIESCLGKQHGGK